MKKLLRLPSFFASLLFSLLLLLLGTYKLQQIPAFWWDEGWTLSVARNWVELGHYGQVLDGVPRATGLSASFPVIAPIALSFRLFGVGLWQGRLPGVIFMLGSLGIMFYLAARLYHRPVAVGMLAVLLLTPVADELQTILIGRQVLGEMPALFYLLGAYAFLILALNKSAGWILPAAILWGISLTTKAQVLPFWLVSLAVPCGYALLKRWWRPAFILGAGFIFSKLAAERLLPWLYNALVGGGSFASDPITGLYSVTAVVTDWDVRKACLQNTFSFGLLTLIGLSWAVWSFFRSNREPGSGSGAALVKLSLLSLAGSWLAWYALLGMVWIRYLFPAVFLGSLFTSAWLYEATCHFELREVFKRAGLAVSLQSSRRLTLRSVLPALGSLFTLVWVCITAALTGAVLFWSYQKAINVDVRQVAAYLNNQTGANALVESYDSELFFLLDRRYHYPPDQVHVEIVRRGLIDPATAVGYDPLPANPDYLVVGPFSRRWQVYDAVVETGAFRLVQTITGYEVYERVRP